MIFWCFCGPGVYAGQGQLVNGVCEYQPSYVNGQVDVCSTAGGIWDAGATPPCTVLGPTSNDSVICGDCGGSYADATCSAAPTPASNDEAICGDGGGTWANDACTAGLASHSEELLATCFMLGVCEWYVDNCAGIAPSYGCPGTINQDNVPACAGGAQWIIDGVTYFENSSTAFSNGWLTANAGGSAGGGIQNMESTCYFMWPSSNP